MIAADSSVVAASLTALQFQELATAAEGGITEPLRNLLQQHGDAKQLRINGITLLTAAASSDFAAAIEVVVQVLRQQSQDVPSELNSLDAQGFAPLHHASKMGNLDCVAALLNAKASLETLTKDAKYLLGQSLPLYQEGGLTSLHLATEEGRAEVVQELIERKADITAKSSFCLSPLDIAREKLACKQNKDRWLTIVSKLGEPTLDHHALLDEGEAPAPTVR